MVEQLALLHRAEGQEKQVIALVNPVASRTEALSGRIDELERGCDGFVDFKRLDTIADPKDNRAQLYQEVEPDSLLVVASGDGTLSEVVRNMALPHPDKPEHLLATRLVACAFGNKNDMARMLAGRHAARPLDVIRHGKPVQVHSMEVTYLNLDGIEEKDLGLYSLGFGAIGMGARMANNPEFRKAQRQRSWVGRHIAEYGLALRALRETPTQTIMTPSGPDEMVSCFCGTGECMAGQWRLPARLAEKEFFVGSIRNKRLRSIARDCVGLLTNTLPHGYLTNSETFELTRRTMGQRDGEDFDVGPGPVQIITGPAVTFISTKLPRS